MNRKVYFLLFIVSLISALGPSRAQKPPEKFGKIDDADLEVTSCPIDPNAHAYYLFDYGYSFFRYADTKVISTDPASTRKGFQLHFTRHFRIKIVDKQGFDWADIGIPLYHDDDEEKVVSLKAFTYYMENGKSQKVKLDKNDIKTEETSANWKTMKFAMPNVTEGSIIEVEYTIQSDYIFNLREWYFQKTIPVLYSEYNVEIPEYYVYNQTISGYYPVETARDKRQTKLTITYVQRGEGLVVEEQTYTQDYDYFENIFQYKAEQIPAFPSEKFVKTENTFLSRVEFELNQTQFPNQTPSYYTVSWEEIDEDLSNNTYFGKELGKGSHLKEDVEYLKTLGVRNEALLDSAFTYFKHKLVWNGTRSKYVTSTLSKAYKDGAGNSADLNLNLVVLLNELGIKSFPIILSTQDNGIIHPSHPSVSRFNYAIAMALINDDVYLMDATDPYSGINLLPERCLNDKGRIIGQTSEKWINLMDYKSYISHSEYDLTLTDDLSVKGRTKMNLKDYGAYDYRKDIKSFEDVTSYAKSLTEGHKDRIVENMEVSGLENLRENLDITYNVVENSCAYTANDMVFLTPVVDPFFEENPFKLEKREFPVEFNYPYQLHQVYTISIPESYEITGIPEDVIASLQDNSASFSYQIDQSGNDLLITSSISIDKSMYLPEEYDTLRQFFQVIIDKQNEYLVLKEK